MVSEEPFSTPLDAFDSVEHFMNRWPDMLAWPMVGWGEGTVGVLCVDEYREPGALVVRAELPGIDPDTDLEVTASNGILHIAAERHEEVTPEGRRYLHHELTHCHRLERDLALPDGVQETAFTANFDNGILDVRIPLPAADTAARVTKIPVTRS